mgnify:CR=1 FL=1|jgi:hypothetical protein
MKKKFVLVLALVLLVASTAFAGDVKFSGRVRQGYVFRFYTNGDAAKITSKRVKEGKLTFKVEDADGLWSLNFGDLNGTLDSNDKLAANASISLSKAMEKAGVDMKDWSIALGIGNTGADTGLRAYNDVNGNGYDKFKNNGTYSADVTVGYGKMVSVKVSADPVTVKNDTTENKRSFAVTALVTPVDGVKVAAGYGYNFVGGATTTAAPVTAKNAIYGAVTVDIAKLASMKDFNLKVSAWDQYAFKDTSTTPETEAKNWMQANIALGTAKVSGYVEYSIFNKVQNLNVTANFNVVKNMGLDAYFDLGTMNDADEMTWDIGGDVSYTFGGVVYSLNAEYDHAKKGSDKHSFALTPAVAISF